MCEEYTIEFKCEQPFVIKDQEYYSVVDFITTSDLEKDDAIFIGNFAKFTQDQVLREILKEDDNPPDELKDIKLRIWIRDRLGNIKEIY